MKTEGEKGGESTPLRRGGRKMDLPARLKVRGCREGKKKRGGKEKKGRSFSFLAGGGGRRENSMSR